MANRTRNIPIRFDVDGSEKELIKLKMKQFGTNNMGAYLRKMAIDGMIVNVDLSAVKENTLAINRIGTNINQIAKRLNSTDDVKPSDVDDIKRFVNEIIKKQKEILLNFQNIL